MNSSFQESRHRNADFPVGAFRRLENRRYALGGMLSQLCDTVLTWFAPPPTLRRYRVTPRANPAAFRHNLLRGIQLELRRSADFPVGDNAGWKTGVTSLSSIASRTTL